MMLTLAEEIVFSSVAQPAKFASSEPKPGDVLRISGWGRFSYNNLNNPDLLHAVEAPVLDLNVCKERYAAANLEIFPDNFCTDVVDGKGSCVHDDGAPVVNDRGEVVGLQAHVSECGDPKYPNRHTSMIYNMDFINSFIGA